MMSLQQQLDEMKRRATENIPKNTLAEMLQATDDLRKSGILERIIKPGSKLPPFRLKNQAGVEVDSNTLLAEKNLVISVFRGHW